MFARETKPDWTTVSGNQWYKVWDGDDYGAREIVSIDQYPLAGAQYTDTDNDYEYITPSYGGIVRHFLCRGDTRGDEAGIRTDVQVYFNPVRVTLRR